MQPSNISINPAPFLNYISKPCDYEEDLDRETIQQVLSMPIKKNPKREFVVDDSEYYN